MPTTIEKIDAAIRRAGEAGDAEAVRALGQELRRLRARQTESAGNTPTNLTQSFAGGFNEGLINMVGAPGAIIAGVAGEHGGTPAQNLFGENAVTRGADAVLDAPRRAARAFGEFIGPENLRQSADGLMARIPGTSENPTMFPEGAQTPEGRITRRIGEEFGAASLPAMGIARAATARPATTRNMLSDAPRAPRMRDAILDPISRTPGRATAGEAIAVAGAGTGAGLALEHDPGNRTAEIYGQLIGGTLPAISPAYWGARAANFVRSKASDEQRKIAARETVRDFFDENLGTTSAREALSRSDQIADTIPGFEPSLAERTGSPGFVRLQSDLEGRMAGRDLDAAVGRRVANEDAVRRYSEDMAPRSDLDADAVIDAGRDRIGRARDRIEGQAQDLQGRREALAGKLPETDLAATGQQLRDDLWRRVGDESAAFRRLAHETGLDDPNFRVPFSEFRDDILTAYNQATRLKMRDGAEGMPAPPAMISRIQNAEDVQDFAALMELRSDIAGNIRRAERMPSTDDTYLRGLRAMKGAFDGALERAVQNTRDPDIARRYADFRRRYQEEYVEPLKQQASAEILARDTTGAYKTPDERVVQEYFQPGGVSTARQFKSVFGSDPAALGAMEAVALDSLRRAAVRDGVIDQRALDRWLRDHQSVLREFPDLAGRVTDIRQANAALLDRQRTLVNRSRAVEDSLLARSLKRVESDAASPADIVQRALSQDSPRRMNQLAGATRNDSAARRALQRQIWDAVGELPPSSLAPFIDEKSAHLRAAGMTQDHLNALKTIDAARVMMSSVPTPRGTTNIPSTPEVFVRQFGIRPDMLANRLREIHTGRSEPAYVFANVMANIMGRKQRQHMDEAFRLVLYDQQLAQQLARSIRGGGIDKAGANRLQSRFFAAGITLFKDDDSEGM